MERHVTTHETFSMPAIEEHLSQASIELQDYAEIQGQQDGQKEKDITELAFKVKVLDFVQTTGQTAINFIKEKILITSHVLNVKEFQQAAKVRSQQVQLLIDDMLQQVSTQERTLKSYIPDPFKYKYRPWLLPVALFVGIADGVMAYSSFRSASYSTMLAFITSMAITMVIAGSHLMYTGWIMASIGTQRILKIASVLAVAFIFFFWISAIRVAGINNTVSIAVPNSDGVLPDTPHVSQWAICGISFTLFTAVLFLSLVVWMTKEERVKCDAYKKAANGLNQKRAEIAALTKEIKEIQQNVSIQKHQARVLYDYLVRSFERAKNSGRMAIAGYKRKYAHFHTTVPEFFADPHELVYEENIDFLEPENSAS